MSAEVTNDKVTNNAAANLKVIITGATGMVGEGVLLECLEHPAVAQVLIVNRRPYPAKHAKLQEIIVPDFLALEAFTSQLTGYDACFFCAGITSAGMSEADYTRITYDVTTNFAQKLAGLNPQMTFDYVSGAYTDSSEQGRLMWARVKGRTENALMRLAFRQVYIFRPGFMLATPGQRNLKWYYHPVAVLYPLAHALLPNYVSTLRDVARAMINSVLRGYPKPILEIKDINALAKA
jgi:nucleoside-diphosphate-sugar epimerase